MNGSRPTATRASSNLSLTNGFANPAETFAPPLHIDPVHSTSETEVGAATSRAQQRPPRPILLETACSGQKNYTANCEVVAHASDRLARVRLANYCLSRPEVRS
jgi:hypothetical protein